MIVSEQLRQPNNCYDDRWQKRLKLMNTSQGNIKKKNKIC